MSWGHLIDDRPNEGVFRVHRDAFRDPAVFEREMTQFSSAELLVLELR